MPPTRQALISTPFRACPAFIAGWWITRFKNADFSPKTNRNLGLKPEGD